MNTSELVTKIMKGELDTELRTIKEACEGRLDTIKRTGLRVGSKARVGNIRPKYVSGAIGTITSVNDTTCTMDFDSVIVGPLVNGRQKRYQHGVRVPMSALTAVGEQVNFSTKPRFSNEVHSEREIEAAAEARAQRREAAAEAAFERRANRY